VSTVLDYSAGWPGPAAIIAGKYAGAVRYIGTPGRSKNLVRAEVEALKAAGIPVALVYEDTAGWMLSGTAAGQAAARNVLSDAAKLGVDVGLVYFAADFDVTNDMWAVTQCLDGAAVVLGADRVGVYGEADVIDAAVTGGHARLGWQTRAWSGGRVSEHAALLQELGYVDVGGVQCDQNTVLAADWGQQPTPVVVSGSTDLEDDEMAMAIGVPAAGGGPWLTFTSEGTVKNLASQTEVKALAALYEAATGKQLPTVSLSAAQMTAARAWAARQAVGDDAPATAG
jgi:Rv2525c-like, glycoside hydrolase-like domain